MAEPVTVDTAGRDFIVSSYTYVNEIKETNKCTITIEAIQGMVYTNDDIRRRSQLPKFGICAN